MNVPKPAPPKVSPTLARAQDPTASDADLRALVEKNTEGSEVALERLMARQKALAPQSS